MQKPKEEMPNMYVWEFTSLLLVCCNYTMNLLGSMYVKARLCSKTPRDGIRASVSRF